MNMDASPSTSPRRFRTVATDSPRVSTREDILRQLYSKLKKVAANWKKFGMQLGIPKSDLDKLTPAKKSSEDCFQDIIDYCLENGSHIWQDIFVALEGISEKRLMRHLECSYEANNAGIPQHKLNAFADEKTCDDYLLEVIQLWYNEYDADNLPLDMIYEALRNIDQRSLASELETFFRGTSHPPQRRVATDSIVDSTTDGVNRIALSSEETVVLRTTNGETTSNMTSRKFPPPVTYPSIQELNFDRRSFTDDLVKDVNVILMTVTDEEFCTVIDQTTAIEEQMIIETHTSDVSFYLGMYGRCKVAIMKTSPGEADIKDRLPRLLKAIKAQYVISIGICYGLNDQKTDLGDVIVADRIRVFTHEHSKADGRTIFVPEHEFAVGKTLQRLFHPPAVGFQLKRSEDEFVKVKVGPIISKPKLIRDKEAIVLQAPDAFGGEMEGGGIINAINEADPKTQFIIIKAIADWGTKDKSDCKDWKPFAAVAAAKYVHYRMNHDDACEALRRAN